MNLKLRPKIPSSVRRQKNEGIFIKSSIRLSFVLLLILLAVLCTQAFGQAAVSKGFISGHVYDYDTKEPIPNASLEIEGLASIKSITDVSGYYNFTINCGKSPCLDESCEISCTSEDYRSTTITKTIDENGNANRTDFYLKSIDKCPGSLSDGFDQENATIWLKSDWLNNDPFFLNTWKSDFDHIHIEDGNLSLNLDNQPCVSNKSQCQNQSFASGECRTTCDQYQYGELEARILAGKGNGVVTGMFFLGGVPGKQDEIDVEIFGKDAIKPGQWEIHTNYFSNGDQGNQSTNGVLEPSHEAIVPLNFDPTQSYHIYRILWTGDAENCTEIKWYVDGLLRREVWLDKTGYVQSNVIDENCNIIADSNTYKGSLPVTKSQIFLNLWAAINWPEAGYFDYCSEKLVQAKIDWIKYSHPRK